MRANCSPAPLAALVPRVTSTGASLGSRPTNSSTAVSTSPSPSQNENPPLFTSGQSSGDSP